MTKIYQKQNPQLSRGPILQPLPPSSYSAQIRAGTKMTTDSLDRVAVENWTLGYSNMVNDIVTQAYEAHPTDLAKFNDMVESGVLKATEKLPGSLSRKLRAGVETKALALQGKIKNNQIDAMNAEQKKKVMVSIDDITGDGPMSMQSLNVLMMDGLINRDEQTVKDAKKAWDAQHERLANIAEIKDGRGNYVIGKEAERNMYKQGLFGKTEAFRAGIERLPQDGLKKFDEEIFQDKEYFMKIYGIDYKTYDDFEKLIKARRKAFDDSDKRAIKDQDHFMASDFLNNDLAVLEDIKNRGTLKDETVNVLEKAYKEARKKGNPDAGFLRKIDKNQGFLAGLAELQNAISVDDGSEEYADNLLQKAANASREISIMRQDGIINEEQAEILQQGLSGVVRDQNFADALDMNDSSLLSEITKGAYNDFNVDNERRKKYYQDLIAKQKPNQEITPEMEQRLERATKFMTGVSRGNIGSKPETIKFSDLTKRALNETAARYSARIIALEKVGQHEEAMKLKSAANKELIYLKYSDWIPRQEFDRLEKELKNGKDAYTKIGNSVFQYKGLSQNGVILEGEF